ncbi:cysteine proteinase [Neoconidiobolus thromboides FSU 785]|nr:cysteine proteinase [Neoconidiobolus thromboides FSU 785]
MLNNMPKSTINGLAYLRDRFGSLITFESSEGDQSKLKTFNFDKEELDTLDVIARKFRHEAKNDVENDLNESVEDSPKKETSGANQEEINKTNDEEEISKTKSVNYNEVSSIGDLIKSARTYDKIIQSDDGREVFVFCGGEKFVQIEEEDIVNRNDVFKITQNGQLIPYVRRYPVLNTPNQYPYSWKHGVGLRNPDVFCYANSLFQSLFNLGYFKDLIMSKAQFECKHGELTDDFGCLLCYLRKRLPSIYKHQGGSTELYKLIIKIAKKMNEGSIYDMKDASEFGLKLLDLLEECFTKMIDNPNPFRHTTVMDNPVHQIFGIVKKDTSSCASKGHESNHFFTDYSLEVLPSKDIYKSLDHHFQSKKIDDRKCDHCDIRGKGKNMVTIHKPPKVLLIKINRTSYSFKKRDDAVEFPTILDISKYTDSNSTTKYQLDSVVVHYGRDAYSGHYVTVTRNKDNEFYMISDASEPELLKFESFKKELYQGACVLSYVLIEDNEEKNKIEDYSLIELFDNHPKKIEKVKVTKSERMVNKTEKADEAKEDKGVNRLKIKEDFNMRPIINGNMEEKVIKSALKGKKKKKLGRGKGTFQVVVEKNGQGVEKGFSFNEDLFDNKKRSFVKRPDSYDHEYDYGRLPKIKKKREDNFNQHNQFQVEQDIKNIVKKYRNH